MPQLDQDRYIRPWIEGVVVAADVVGDSFFEISGVSSSDIEKAVAAVTGQDRMARPNLEKSLTVVDSGGISPSEDADWVDGFEDALCWLARTIDVGSTDVSPYSAAVIGLPVYRNEWDAVADVEQVKRLLKDGPGVSVASCWPDGSSVADLAAVGRAGYLFALPYGRRAARVIADRTGATVVDICLPFGFDGVSTFVRTAAAALGREHRAEEYLSRELKRIVPRFEWVVPHSLLNKRIQLVGDAVFVESARIFLYETGCDVCSYFLTGSGSFEVDLSDITDSDPTEPFALTVGNSCSVADAMNRKGRFLEVTYPRSQVHTLYPRPFLGLDGAAAFLEEMVNRMVLFEIMESWRNWDVSEEDR